MRAGACFLSESGDVWLSAGSSRPPLLFQTVCFLEAAVEKTTEAPGRPQTGRTLSLAGELMLLSFQQQHGGHICPDAAG